MTANILSIGDELLIGQTLNTNAHWMANQLTQLGIRVKHVVTLSDEAEDIKESLSRSMEEATITLITGGLGPTNDDITRDVLCEFFDSELVWDQRILQRFEKLFADRERVLTDEVKDMARVPVKAITLYNKMGTAPGMLFKKDGKVAISMPGVPYEMRAMMENDVLPWIKDNYELPVIVNEHILTAGRGESQIASKIKAVEDKLPAHIKLAYLPDIGKVKLRLTARGNDATSLKADVEVEKAKIMAEVGHYVYGFNNDTLEGSIGKTLAAKKIKIGTAESCTGGNIAARITSVSGSSAYFEGTIVSYSNEIKKKLLNVSESNLEQFGAVSEEVVREMIVGAIHQLEVDISIAVSGVAGPTGGTETKPVGTVYIGVGTINHQEIKRFQFVSDREKNIEITTVVALVMLRKYLAEHF
ncbi:MAG: competence/damage-inducible protein A [Chitinophagales bacterium]